MNPTLSRKKFRLPHGAHQGKQATNGDRVYLGHINCKRWAKNLKNTLARFFCIKRFPMGPYYNRVPLIKVSFFRRSRNNTSDAMRYRP